MCSSSSLYITRLLLLLVFDDVVDKRVDNLALGQRSFPLNMFNISAHKGRCT